MGIDYIVSDPVRWTYFKLGYIQYMILRYFQTHEGTIRDGVSHLDQRCGVELDEKSIASFLHSMEKKGFLEPDRHTSLDSFDLFTLSSELREHLRYLIRKEWRNKNVTEREKSFTTDIFTCLKSYNIIGALEIAEQAQRTLPEKGLADLFYQEIRSRILETLKRKSTQETSSDPASSSNSSTSKGMLPFTRMIKLADPQNFLKKMSRFIQVVYSRTAIIFYIILFITAQTIVWRNRELFFSWGYITRNVLQHFVFTAIIGNLCMLFHELGHAMVCHKFGGKVRRLGVMLFFGIIPAAFADVTDSYFMTRNRRIFVMLAGVINQIILASICAIIWNATPPEYATVRTLAFIVTATNGLVIYQNLLPILKLDGYYIFSDLMGIENLFQKSNAYCFNKIFGSKKDLPSYTRKETFAIWFYWTLNLFFASSIILLSVQAEMAQFGKMSYFFQVLRLLILFALVGSVVNWVISIVRSGSVQFGQFWNKKNSISRSTIFYNFKSKFQQYKNAFLEMPLPRRVAFSLAVILLLPLPYNLEVIGRLEPKMVDTIRIDGEGVLTSLYVKEGSHVKSGQLLLRISNPSVEAAFQRELWLFRKELEESKARMTGLTSAERRVEERRVEVASAALAGQLLTFTIYDQGKKAGVISEQERQNVYEHLEQMIANLDVAQAVKNTRVASLTGPEIDMERAQIKSRQLRLASLQADLEKFSVYAPHDGIVLTPNLAQQMGRYIKRGEEILRVAGYKKHLEFYVSEKDVDSLTVNQPFTFATPSSKQVILKGKLSFIAPTTENISGTKQNFYSIFPRASYARVTGELVGDIEENEHFYGTSGNVKIRCGIWPLIYVLFKDMFTNYHVSFWNLL